MSSEKRATQSPECAYLYQCDFLFPEEKRGVDVENTARDSRDGISLTVK